MKPLPLFLGLSLSANAAFLVLLAVGIGATQSTDAPRERKSAAPARVLASTPALVNWSALQAEELPLEVAHLRAEGFPPDIIRAILRVRIYESLVAGLNELKAKQAAAPYWKFKSSDDAAIQAAYRELWRTEHKTLDQLLGPDPENGAAAIARRQFPGWSADKIDAYAAMQARYEEQQQNLFNHARGAWLPEDREKYAALQRAQHAEIAALLSPTELADYDLRTSDTANNLREQLSAFDATEQEFRALYQLRSAASAQLDGFIATPDQMKAYRAAQQQFETEARTALGDARYADYQRATNYDFRQTSELVDRLGLPTSTAVQVYAVEQDTQQRASALARDATLTPTDRTARLAALAAEVQAQVTASLGAEGYEAYKQHGGQWLGALTRSSGSR